jgi:hypothetical protein
MSWFPYAEVSAMVAGAILADAQQHLLFEGSEMIDEEFEASVKDAGIIGAAQRVEHYEIAAYGTVRAFAETLGHDDHIKLLGETLEEEKQTDDKLTELAKHPNRQEKEAGPQRTEKTSESPDFKCWMRGEVKRAPRLSAPWIASRLYPYSSGLSLCFRYED